MYHALPADDKAIATALVNSALSIGAVISVYDGEDWPVKWSADKAAILDAIGNTDTDTVRVRYGDQKADFVLVYGNRDGTTIADHSDNALADRLAIHVRPTEERFQ